MFTLLHSFISFLTFVLHSCTALSKSSETRRLFGGGFAGGMILEGSEEVWSAKGRIVVALLNFGGGEARPDLVDGFLRGQRLLPSFLTT